MKTYTLILAIILFAGITSAQIVLGPEKLISTGDKITIWQMDTTNTNEGEAGADRSWDFSGLESVDALVMDFVNASETPYQDSFPEASLAGVISEGEIANYTYYSVSDNKVYSQGTASGGFSTIYSNIETTASYPFTYNSSFDDYYEGVTDLGDGLISLKTGEVLVTGDAYGNITLPDGSNVNALRLKTIRTSVDSLFENEIFMGETFYNTTTYSWYTAEAKYPVFSISYIQIEVFGELIEMKNVEFIPQSSTGVDEDETLVDRFELKQNFPNPFNPSTRISFSLKEKSFVSLKVYNITGEEISLLVNDEMESGEYSVDFNAANLPAGVYFYTLSSNEFHETKKMILLK